ncbi:MAG: ion channel [Enhygromyxa sp.]
MLLLWFVRLVRRVRSQRLLGFLVIALLLSISLLGNAACFYTFERAVDPDISWGDALWYSVVSISTIGYGDLAASTPGARLGMVFFIVLLGLASFSLFFGMALDLMAVAIQNAKKGLGRIMVSDHILIVHFPSEHRVRQIINEIRSDPVHGDSEIVIVTDAIEELPFIDERIVFVRGSSHDVETYERARARHSQMAIVLSPDYSSSNSDAIVAAAVSVIDRVNTDIHIVAECLHEKHRALFDSCNCNAVVLGMTIAGNLLVQEVHDPGLAQLVEVVSSNRRGTTLFCVDVSDAAVSYRQLAQHLLDHEINVMAVNRGTETFTLFGGVESQVGDRLIYSARERIEWAGLRRLAS